MFTGALYLQRVLHYGAIKTGLAFLPLGLAIGALSIGAAARLARRLGAKMTLICGLALITAGLAMLSRAPVAANYPADLLPAMILIGTGAGIAFPSLMSLAMSAATPEDSGLASGLLNTTQQAGGALGLAVLATVSATRTSTLHAHGAPLPTALADGYRLAFTVAAAAIILGIILAAALLPSPRNAAAPRQDTPASAHRRETALTGRRLRKY